MDQGTNQIFFALLRSAVCGVGLSEEEKKRFSAEQLQDLMNVASKHDLEHLVAYSLKQNELIPKEYAALERCIFKAAYRYEQLKYEYDELCQALEEAKIQFLPLKGSVLRQYYPEPWMRTSCDIDVLVHRNELENAISYLTEKLGYEEKGKASHDVSLFSATGVHIELHFDLVEEGRANNAINVLSTVWDNVSLRRDSEYWYEMSDDFFYFYHIAHMAKHFETGGCGVRPFIDLWILDHIDGANKEARDALLEKGGLLKFAEQARILSNIWFGDGQYDNVSYQFQNFLFHGGVYGSTDNRVALHQKKKGGRIGYIISRMFIPYANLKRYYPVLEKHKWLMPVMQIRRWFMLLKPDVAKMAKSEILANGNIESARAEQMDELLKNIGL